MSASSPLSTSLARQTTLQSVVKISGIGMHRGEPASVKVKPAPPDHGLRFSCGGTRFAAAADFVVNTRRATCLGSEGARVDTVEHILSALNGLLVDNALIEVDGPEIPILDGSARPWVEAILEAGVEETDAEIRPLRLLRPIALREGDSWMTAVPADRFVLTCVTHFDHPLLGTQALTFEEDAEEYAAQVAPARTFGFAAEVEALRAAGLALGGSLDNALVIYEDRFSDALRVPDECLRHKALDLFGDLALAGGRLCASVTAIMPGHRINTSFAALLAENSQRDG